MTAPTQVGVNRTLPLQGDSVLLTPTLQPCVIALTSVQESALELYDSGFNVMPIPRVGMEYKGKKPPYGKFGVLFTTRVHRDYIPDLFERANIVVICGRLSLFLFVLDCDTQSEFERVGRELKQRGIKAWAVTSSRGGHYWLLCAEGEVKSKDVSKVLQVKGAGGYVVAPPSVHPTGVIYEWLQRDGNLPPVVSIDALDFLLGIELVRHYDGDLPPTARCVLVEHDTGKYASHSEAEFAAVMALAKAGWGDAEIVEAFDRYKPPHYSGTRNPAKWLQRHMITPARNKTGTRDSRTEIDARSQWALSRPWPSRTGETDRNVYLALCERARRDGRVVFRASVREVSQLANVNKDTAANALHRLINAKLIELAGRDELSHSALYRFSGPVGVIHTLSPCNDSVRFTPPSDAWHTRALGKTGLAVYRALLAGGELMAGPICKRTGRSKRAVRRALEKLRQFGLADLAGGELWCAEPANAKTFDAIARACGTAGKSAKRSERYAVERSKRVSWLLLQQKRAWEKRKAKR